MNPICLASGSPRRRSLLTLMGIPFDACPVEIDERFDGTAEDAVRAVALRKASAAQKEHPASVILAADTLVTLDGQLLGKPRDEQDAARMLRLLSGRRHEVYTGVCLLASDKTDIRTEKTSVTFARLSDALIRRYVQSGEPMDKAGAYGIQGMGGMLVRRVCGCPSNVIGLPMSMVLDMLRPYMGLI